MRTWLRRGLMLPFAALFASGAAGAALDGGEAARPFLSRVQRTPEAGGRDPFRDPETGPDTPRPAGLGGVRIMETVIRGIVRLQVPAEGAGTIAASGWAVLETPSGEGFVVAPGDRLLDGVLGRLEEGAAVFWLDGDPGRPAVRPLAVPGVEPEEGR